MAAPNNNRSKYAGQYTGTEERNRLFAKGSDPYSSLGSANLNKMNAPPNAPPAPENFLTLGFGKFKKDFASAFKAGRLRNVNPRAMMNTARINAATKELEDLQAELEERKHNRKITGNALSENDRAQLNYNINMISHSVNKKMNLLGQYKGDRNAAIQQAALKRLSSKVSMFNRFLNTMKKGTRKITGVFSSGNSSTRKNVMAKASKALNSLQDMGGIAESINRIAKAIEDCCEDDTGKSVSPSNLGNNNNGGSNGGNEPRPGPGPGPGPRNGGEEPGAGNNNGSGVRVPGIENENNWNAAREAAGRRAGENNGPEVRIPGVNNANNWNAAREAAGRRAGENNNNGGVGGEGAGGEGAGGEGAGGNNNANSNANEEPNVRPRAPTEADYRELELEPGATLAEVRRAFRRLAARYHPNRPTGNTVRMQRINGAYERIRKYLEYFERHPEERPPNGPPPPGPNREALAGNLGYGGNNNGRGNGNVGLRGFFGNNNFENEAPAAGRRAEEAGNNNWNAAREAAGRRAGENNLNNGPGAGENANAAYMRAFNEGQRRRAAAAAEANAERRRRAQANLNRLEREEAEEAAEEARRAAINAARAEQEARRRANINAGPGGLNNFEPGGRLPNNFFNEEEAGGAAAGRLAGNGNRRGLAAGAAAANANAARALEAARAANEAAARAAEAAAEEARRNAGGAAGPSRLAGGAAAAAAGLAGNANLAAAEAAAAAAAANAAARAEAENIRRAEVRAGRAAARNAAANEVNAVNPGGLFGNNNFEPAAAPAAAEAALEAANANAAAARANGIAAAAAGNNGAAAAAARANEEAAAANAAAATAAAEAAEQARRNAAAAANNNANVNREISELFANNAGEPAGNSEKNMANAAERGLSRSLKKSNPLTNGNANLEAFKARKRAGAAAPVLPGFRLTGKQPKSPANLALEAAAAANNGNVPPPLPEPAAPAVRPRITTVENLTPDERQRYNDMVNLTGDPANALRMLQQNRNAGRNVAVPVVKQKKKGKRVTRRRN